ncbi:1946_t:CDS:2, partial [Ambispora leptoticha]
MQIRGFDGDGRDFNSGHTLRDIHHSVPGIKDFAVDSWPSVRPPLLLIFEILLSEAIIFEIWKQLERPLFQEYYKQGLLLAIPMDISSYPTRTRDHG